MQKISKLPEDHVGREAVKGVKCPTLVMW